MNRWQMAWVVWALGVAAVVACGPAGKENAKPAGEAGEPVVFEVTGMHCEGCAAAIAKSLEGLPGVQSAKVSFDEKRAVVVPTKGQFDPDTVPPAVKQLGGNYEARLAAAAKK